MRVPSVERYFTTWLIFAAALVFTDTPCLFLDALSERDTMSVVFRLIGIVVSTGVRTFCNVSNLAVL